MTVALPNDPGLQLIQALQRAAASRQTRARFRRLFDNNPEFREALERAINYDLTRHSAGSDEPAGLNRLLIQARDAYVGVLNKLLPAKVDFAEAALQTRTIDGVFRHAGQTERVLIPIVNQFSESTRNHT